MHAYAFSNPPFIIDSLVQLVEAANYIGCGALRVLRVRTAAA
jgi:hypothetical protein